MAVYNNENFLKRLGKLILGGNPVVHGSEELIRKRDQIGQTCLCRLTSWPHLLQ